VGLWEGFIDTSESLREGFTDIPVGLWEGFIDTSESLREGFTDISVGLGEGFIFFKTCLLIWITHRTYVPRGVFIYPSGFGYLRGFGGGVYRCPRGFGGGVYKLK